MILDDDDVLTSSSQLDNEAEVKEDDEKVASFDKEDHELSRALEEALLISAAEKSGDEMEAESEDCFDDFQLKVVDNPFMGAFLAGQRFKKAMGKKARLHKKLRDLPPPPSNLAELERHPLREDFLQAQKEHLASHEQMGSREEFHKKYARGLKVLGCMWLFIYKTDKHGVLKKCKARLMVLGNQQALGELPTRATTLASVVFRVLMAITARFDLETVQMNVVNAFVHCKLDEVVYMRMPPGYEAKDKVLRLRKVLYGLRCSPLLWQTELTKTFRDLGFKELPQEPCMMIKSGVIVFFYVDDIIFCYRKSEEPVAKKAIKRLEAHYTMKLLEKLRWFLEIHIL